MPIPPSEKVKQFPNTPGVYLMKDEQGRVIYVGKAKHLRNRASHYFSKAAAEEARTADLVKLIADIDFLPAESEVDALLLEARLVKDVQPRFNIDLKPEQVGIIGPTLKVIDAAGMRRMVLLTSEFQPRLDEIRGAAAEIPTSFGYFEIAAFMQAMAARDASYHPPGDAIQIPPEYYSWKLATPETVEMAHRHGIEVHVWTVNEEAEMRAMLELGVDGVMSDFPGLALKVSAARPRRG